MKVKYPRTFHLPSSPGRSSDDKVHDQATLDSMFSDREVVVTIKMDGENSTMYADGSCHARSLDSGHHESRSWVKQLASWIGHQLPKGWRICGENCFATHSVHYDGLPSYFMTFAIYDEDNLCLSWDDTVEWTELLGLDLVPVIYRGPWDEKAIHAAWENHAPSFGKEDEGYVVRLAASFRYDEFSRSVAKWVRPGHVTTDVHWMHQEIVPNELA